VALTGLDIYKLLPKTNCGDCGVPTCLAFAMKLAQKKAELSECPHASEEAKKVLGAASEPPMQTLKIGVGANAFEIGGETEMFRHEKTFCHQTAIAVQLNDSNDLDTIISTVREVEDYVLDRVGERLQIDALCLSNASGNREHYLKALEAVSANTSKAVILDCDDLETVKAAIDSLNGKKPIIYPRNSNADQYVEVAMGGGAGLIVGSEAADDLATQVENIIKADYKNLILGLTSDGIGNRLQNSTILRRAALRKGFKPFGFPQVWFLKPGDDRDILADAVLGMCKYASLMVVPKFSREMMLTLLTLRQNIFTDPQKPIQVDPRLYAVGEPKPDSPVFVTTNFSLTYFIVSGEIENAGISAWLVVPDCEGMSVLTAWAAGKFSADKIGKFAKEISLEDRVKTRDIIIPGYVANISGELEETMPNWNVLVGPQEASDLGPFLNHYLKR
jgi:acetyl-CoA decarbonylase/synthase complex subunit gamma